MKIIMASKLRNDIRRRLKDGLKKGYVMNEKYEYYFTDYNDNLLEQMSPNHKKMFDGANGNELKDKVYPAKAKAIDSSSMLAYNFFRYIDSNHSIVINNIRYNKCLFEVKLPTLASSGASANIDVVLLSEDRKTILFIESKFLEYLDNDSTILPESYYKKKSFYSDNAEISDLCWMCNKYEVKKSNYNYGIKQNICHLVGISNIVNSKVAREKFLRINGKIFDNRDLNLIINENKTILLMNVIFVPNENNDAIASFKKYFTRLNEFLNYVPQKYISKPFVMTYKEIHDILPNNLDKSIKDWLHDRYINYHTTKDVMSDS